MATNYDDLYKTTPNALGEPTRVIVDFFKAYPVKRARVLDVGCGQGRDALFIARLGHSVTGVDISSAGITGLLAEGGRLGLSVTAEVADLVNHQPAGVFDVILIDRTLHMLAEPDRHAVLARLLDHIAPAGTLLIADEPSNIAGFRSVLETADTWRTILAKGGYLFVTRA